MAIRLVPAAPDCLTLNVSLSHDVLVNTHGARILKPARRKAAKLPDSESHNPNAVVTALWSNYEKVRRWISTNIPNSIARQTDADDVLQESFIEAYRNSEGLAQKEDQAALNWLSLVAKRKLIDGLRRSNAKRRKAKDAGTVTTEHVEIPALMTTPSSYAARREAKELLNDALAQLSERHRTVVQLRFFEDRPYSEVAEQMEISVEAAQMLTKRALRKLKQSLGNRSRLFA